MSSPLMTSVTSKLRSRLPGSNLVFALPCCSCVPNLVRIRQIFLQILSENHLSCVGALMTSVTLKMMSRLPNSNLVFDLLWCFYVKNFVRIRQIFLQILSGNHLSSVVALNDLCDLENEVKVTGSNMVFVLPWCFCLPNLVRIHQIFLEISCIRPHNAIT